MAVWSFLFLTVLGLIILRRREPSLDRPYRVVVIIPSAFCCVAIIIVVSSTNFAPIQASILFMLVMMHALIR
jgi:solute carrier family 7 (L-type amino acid transporter), member 9/15